MPPLLYFNIPATGHMNPTSPVIHALVAAGQTVLYYNTPEQRAAVEATGATFVPYPSDEEMVLLLTNSAGGSLGDNSVAFLAICEKLIGFVSAEIAKHQPQLILHDSLASWGALGARMHHIPTVALITTFVLKPDAAPQLIWDDPLGGLALLADLIRATPAANRIIRRMKRQLSGVRPPTLTDVLMNTGDQGIVFTSRIIQVGGDTFAKNFHFVGASIAPRPSDSMFSIHEVTQQRPFVYISLGTINNTNLAFYRMCFAAFGAIAGTFLLSIGTRTSLESLGEIPANFVVRPFVPQLEVLAEADAFITHAGLNSAHEACWFGVPTILIPQQAEQRIVAQRLQALGAGIVINSPTVERLQNALTKVLATSAYAMHAQKIGKTLRQSGGYTKALEIILNAIPH